MPNIGTFFKVKGSAISCLFMEDRTGQVGEIESYYNYIIGLKFNDGVTRFFWEWDVELVNQ